MKKHTEKLCGLMLVGSLVSVLPVPAFARKTNQPVFEDPFDMAGGGASLTKASKEAKVFVNPALMPYGGKFHRWLGTSLNVLVNREAFALGQELISGSSSDEGDSESQSESAQDFIDTVFDTPVHVGWGQSLSWITSRFGLVAFSRFEPDFTASKHEAYGLPAVHFSAESYHGLAGSLPIVTPWRWLSFGITAKYMLASEPDVTVPITDRESIAQLSSPDFFQDLTNHNSGVGFDVGSLIFLQGDTVDYLMAVKVDDVGDTKFSDKVTYPEAFRQVISAGLGLTFHTGADAIHFSADLRDVTREYGESLYKRLYLGAKLLIRTYIGVAAGYYQGSPSYGAELDLIFCRLAFTAVTRELGDKAGLKPRNLYVGSISFGF